MKRGTKILFLLALVLLSTVGGAEGQSFYWSNLAGTPGGAGSLDGAGTGARFKNPNSVAVDTAGNVYVADSANHTIRKITTAGVVTTLAGTAGVSGSTNGAGSVALFNYPTGIAVDGGGNVYVADSGNFTIREITSGGTVSTLAGIAGTSGSADGSAGSALFGYPAGIAVDSSGNVYVADSANNTIRKISGGTVSTLAGTAGVPGALDGTGSAAQFNGPTGAALTGSGATLYVADTYNHTIRKIVTSTGAVTTLAGNSTLLGYTDGTGSNALFYLPGGVAVDGSGNIYVADTANDTIRELTSAGVSSTLAGSVGSTGITNGSGTTARFNGPIGIAVDSNENVYVADTGNSIIRKVSYGVTSTFAGAPSEAGTTNGAGTVALFNGISGVAVDGSGNIYAADTLNHLIRKVTTAAGVITTTNLAGDTYDGIGQSGSANGTGSAASFNYPSGVAISGANLYVADTYNHLIRQITIATGAVTTLAGTTGIQGNVDATGTNAEFNNPTGIATGSSGNIYVADTYNQTIRMVTSAGVVTTIAGTPGVTGNNGTTGSVSGTAALFNYPTAIATDSSGNLYVTDRGNYTVRKLTPSGETWSVTTLAGTPGVTGSSDGTGAAASFGYLTGITVDGGGNVYVVDGGNNTVRMITPAGVVSTIGGTVGVTGGMDGISTSAQFSSPVGIAAGTDGTTGTILYLGDYGNNRISIGSCLGTQGATSITSSGATLNGQAFDGATSVYFNYGTTTAYGSTIAATLPGSGESFSAVSAILTGLTADKTYDYQLVVVNANGTFYGANETFTTLPSAAPAITSTTNSTWTYGVANIYQIAASNGPTSYGATNLPSGLSLNPATGLISGTATTTGVSSVTLSATNVVGTGAKTLNLTVNALPLPVLTSPASATAVAGSWFGYLIASTNSTLGYSVSGLPSGLVLSTSTNEITGTPAAEGTNEVVISATNAAGTTNLPLTLAVTPPYQWSDYAGRPGIYGSSNGTGTNASFAEPYGVAVDGSGNVYVADTYNDEIRKIAPGGVVTTLAGTAGTSGSTNSPALFNGPQALAVDGSGNVYVADTGNNSIREITPGGTVSTIATGLGSPQGITVNSSGTTLYVADTDNEVIRQMTYSGTTWGTPTVLAGDAGSYGSSNGTGTNAKFDEPEGLGLDGSGNVYVADSDNDTIREITPAGVVTTIAGTVGLSGSTDGFNGAGLFEYPDGIAVDSGGNIYVASTDTSTIRKIIPQGSNWMVTTIGGAPYTFGSASGVGTAALFSEVYGIAVDPSGNLYAADTYNYRISKGTQTSPPTAAPLITSSLTAGGIVGTAFGYNITAGNTPTSYHATDLPAGLSVNTTSGLISGTPTEGGSFFATISASNAGGTGSSALDLTIETAYQAWQNENFTTAQLANPAISGDTATPANDGVTNLMKYALGLTALQSYNPGSASLPSVQIENFSGTNYLTLTFTGTATDVTYTVQATSDLTGAWTTVYTYTGSTALGAVTIKDTSPISTTAPRFMRLQVTGP